MRTQLLGLAVILALATNAWAHDQSMHKGKPTHGTVTAVRGDALTLKTDDGDVAVKLTEETTLERGEKAADRTVLVAGAHVSVMGTKVPGEGLVATEIVVEDGKGGHEHGEHMEHGEGHRSMGE